MDAMNLGAKTIKNKKMPDFSSQLQKDAEAQLQSFGKKTVRRILKPLVKGISRPESTGKFRDRIRSEGM